MFRKLIFAVTALIVSASALSAQEPVRDPAGQKFHRYNRWMAGVQFVSNSRNHLGFGVNAAYGRQFSEVLFLGIGFGADAFIGKEMQSETVITYEDGSQTVTILPPYRYSFLVPVYADLQVDFSRKPSPFFAEFKIGAAFDIGLERIKGTSPSVTPELDGGGALLGSSVGKRFRLRNNDEIDVKVGVDCILGPFYMNVPVSIGVRYGF